MTRWASILRLAAAASLGTLLVGFPGPAGYAQEQAAAAATTEAQAPEPLTEDELEVLVARIALYPDELIAVISGASLYPLQVVEAARFLEDYEKDKSLKPKDTWDGSVISLLNYPEVVKMMSDDLDWTQQFGDAIAYQQKDVLVAIQQLREEAVAKDIIKTDDKIKVVQENDNVVIQSVSTDKVYVPRYEPQMLYTADYPPAPIAYYPDPYPSYWYPGATFFAAAATGAVWAAAVDWDDWDVWGGDWDGGDIDIDCDHCFNNRDFNGKVNFNDIDWKNVDRSKLRVDRNQLAKFDRTNVKNRIKANSGNELRTRAASIRNERTGIQHVRTGGARDVRKTTIEGLKGRSGDIARARPNVNRPDVRRPTAGASRSAAEARRRTASRPSISKPAANRVSHHVNRPVSRPKPHAKIDHRPRTPSGLGHVNRGRVSMQHSSRGHRSMGGGFHGGGHRAVHRGGGRRR
jgi:Protein of unknown function (DUF3300)